MPQSGVTNLGSDLAGIRAVLQSKDGALILVGGGRYHSTSDGSNLLPFIATVGPDGVVESTRTYARLAFVRFHEVIADDRGLLVLAQGIMDTDSPAAVLASDGIYLLRFSQLGDFDGVVSEFSDLGVHDAALPSIHRTKDGGILVLLVRRQNGLRDDLRLIRLDAAGERVFEYDFTAELSFGAVQELADGILLLPELSVVADWPQLFLTRLSPNGLVQATTPLTQLPRIPPTPMGLFALPNDRFRLLAMQTHSISYPDGRSESQPAFQSVVISADGQVADYQASGVIIPGSVIPLRDGGMAWINGRTIGRLAADGTEVFRGSIATPPRGRLDRIIELRNGDIAAIGTFWQDETWGPGQGTLVVTDDRGLALEDGTGCAANLDRALSLESTLENQWNINTRMAASSDPTSDRTEFCQDSDLAAYLGFLEDLVQGLGARQSPGNRSTIHLEVGHASDVIAVHSDGPSRARIEADFCCGDLVADRLAADILPALERLARHGPFPFSSGQRGGVMVVNGGQHAGGPLTLADYAAAVDDMVEQFNQLEPAQREQVSTRLTDLGSIGFTIKLIDEADALGLSGRQSVRVGTNRIDELFDFLIDDYIPFIDKVEELGSAFADRYGATLYFASPTPSLREQCRVIQDLLEPGLPIPVRARAGLSEMRYVLSLDDSQDLARWEDENGLVVPLEMAKGGLRFLIDHAKQCFDRGVPSHLSSIGVVNRWYEFRTGQLRLKPGQKDWILEGRASPVDEPTEWLRFNGEVMAKADSDRSTLVVTVRPNQSQAAHLVVIDGSDQHLEVANAIQAWVDQNNGRGVSIAHVDAIALSPGREHLLVQVWFSGTVAKVAPPVWLYVPLQHGGAIQAYEHHPRCPW